MPAPAEALQLHEPPHAPLYKFAEQIAGTYAKLRDGKVTSKLERLNPHRFNSRWYLLKSEAQRFRPDDSSAVEPSDIELTTGRLGITLIRGISSSILRGEGAEAMTGLDIKRFRLPGSAQFLFDYIHGKSEIEFKSPAAAASEVRDQLGPEKMYQSDVPGLVMAIFTGTLKLPDPNLGVCKR